MADRAPKATTRRASFPTLAAAGLLIVLASACGGGGGSRVPACREGTPTLEAVTPTPESQLTLRVGSYEGTGSPQCIRGIGFQPILVIIKGDAAQFALWRSASMQGDSTADFANGQPILVDAITSLDPDAFSLGKHPSVNEQGLLYQYIAFADSRDIKVGSYIGDGNNGLRISGLGFEPALLVVKWDGRRTGVWTSTTHEDGVSSLFHAERDQPGFILALDDDGFEVSSDPWVNYDSGAPDLERVYHYFAFREAPGLLATGTYVGDGSASREISGIGFQPDYVWVKSVTKDGAAVHRTSAMTGDTTLRFTNEPNGTDEIKALSADGFTVSASLNVNAEDTTYHYVAWKASAGP